MNIKVKLKVSGQFKSTHGTREMNEFETIRNIVDGKSVF